MKTFFRTISVIMVSLLVFTVASPLVNRVYAAPIPDIDQNAIRTDTVQYLPNIPGGCSVTGASTGSTVASGSSVYILGDSITVRTAPDYTAGFQAKGMNTTISAVSGRSWTSAGNPAVGKTGTPGPASSAVDTDSPAIKSAGAIVIALGTNNYSAGNPINDIYNKIRTINSSAPIWWVNVANGPPGNPSVPSYNSQLDQAAPGKFTVIPWAKTVDPAGEGTNNPKGILEDGTHPWVGARGTKILADLVVAAVAGAASAPSSAASTTPSTTAPTPAAGTNSSVPIPANPPVIDNAGLENAKIPANRLVAVNTVPNVTDLEGGIQIRKELASPLGALAAGFKQRFGRNLSVFSGYRDAAAQQVSVNGAAAKGHPERAAPVGQSSHGWGLAVDIVKESQWSETGGGNFNSEEYKWLATEGVKLGWKNPYYQGHGGLAAEESWHWEYGTTNTWGAGSGGQAAAATSTTNSCVCPSGGTTSTGNLPGSSPQEKAYLFFVSNGAQPFQAAAVTGNLMRESGLNPTILNTTGSGAYGIGQWLGGRLTEMRSWTTSQGLDSNSIDGQLRFLYHESSQRDSRTYPGTKEWDGLKKQATIEDAVKYWEHNFERADDPPDGIAKRLGFANQVLTSFGSGAPSSSVGASSGSCGSVAGNGQTTTLTLNYEDTSRNRKLKTTVMVPNGGGPFPIVMFAHGFQKGPDAYTRYMQAIASKGYIVVAPSFPNADEHGVLPLNRPDSLPKQPADLKFVLDQILKEPQLQNKIKPDSVAMVGHSDGAIDALLVGYSDQKDSRYKAVISVSSDDISSQLGSGPPLLQLHGDKDTIARHDGDFNNYKKINASPKYFFTMINADHFNVVAVGSDDTPALDALTVGFLDQLLNGKPDTMRDIAGQFNGKVKQEQ